MTQVYDVTTDEFREATQEDVDLLQSSVQRLAVSCGALREKLAEANDLLAVARPVVEFAQDVRWALLAEGAEFRPSDRKLLGTMFRQASSALAKIVVAQGAQPQTTSAGGELRSKLARARDALCLALPVMHADESPKGKTDYSVVREVYRELVGTQE